MMYVYKLIFLFGIVFPMISSRHVQFFRKDYSYIEEFDAFYKLHWDRSGMSWDSAFLACDDEGATFFYPKNKNEWTLVKTLIDDMTEPPNVTDIFVGLHDEFGVGEFVTVDGHPTLSPFAVQKPDHSSELLGGNCVLMNIDSGSYRVAPCVNMPEAPLPFVCKKVDVEICPTIDRDYKYIKSSKKCYKVNRRQKMWDEAMRTCYMEGGILTVLGSEEEANEIRKILKHGTQYHAGFRKLPSQDDYYTVKGQKIDEVYQNSKDTVRYYGEVIDDQNERSNVSFCGALYVGEPVYTVATNCVERLPFICEMEANM